GPPGPSRASGTGRPPRRRPARPGRGRTLPAARPPPRLRAPRGGPDTFRRLDPHDRSSAKTTFLVERRADGKLGDGGRLDSDELREPAGHVPALEVALRELDVELLVADFGEGQVPVEVLQTARLQRRRQKGE